MLGSGVFEIPGLKVFAAAVRRRKIGIVNAIYCAMAPMLKTAPIATGLANMSKPKRAFIERSESDGQHLEQSPFWEF